MLLNSFYVAASNGRNGSLSDLAAIGQNRSFGTRAERGR
jgi:hypothetical protein